MLSKFIAKPASKAIVSDHSYVIILADRLTLGELGVESHHQSTS